MSENQRYNDLLYTYMSDTMREILDNKLDIISEADCIHDAILYEKASKIYPELPFKEITDNSTMYDALSVLEEVEEVYFEDEDADFY